MLERHVAAPLRRVCRVLCSRLQMCILPQLTRQCGVASPHCFGARRVLRSQQGAPLRSQQPCRRSRWRASEKNKKKMESDGGASTRASTRATAARSAALLRPLRSAPLAERRRSSTRPGGRRGRRRPQQGAEAKGAARQAPRPGAARRRARRAKPSWPRSSAVPGSGAL